MSAGETLGALRELRVGSTPSLAAILGIPDGAKGLVIFAHGSGSGRLSPRNNYVARCLRKAGLATLLLDLLTPEEEAVRLNVLISRCLPLGSGARPTGRQAIRKRQGFRSAISAPARVAVQPCVRLRAIRTSQPWSRAAAGPTWPAPMRLCGLLHPHC